jgi:hypothetical protein
MKMQCDLCKNESETIFEIYRKSGKIRHICEMQPWQRKPYRRSVEGRTVTLPAFIVCEKCADGFYKKLRVEQSFESA